MGDCQKYPNSYIITSRSMRRLIALVATMTRPSAVKASRNGSTSTALYAPPFVTAISTMHHGHHPFVVSPPCCQHCCRLPRCRHPTHSPSRQKPAQQRNRHSPAVRTQTPQRIVSFLARASHPWRGGAERDSSIQRVLVAAFEPIHVELQKVVARDFFSFLRGEAGAGAGAVLPTPITSRSLAYVAAAGAARRPRSLHRVIA